MWTVLSLRSEQSYYEARLYSDRPQVNHLLLGTADKTQQLLELTKPGFLLIDDGPIADAFLEHFNAREFDPSKHSFNPLKGMDYKRARDFAATVYTASPQGENTLTVRNGKRALTKLLLANPTRLDKLKPKDEETEATLEDLLLSPVLTKVLCNPTNFSFKGSVVARINRAELGEFDSFILASLLIGQSKGQIILSDSGFYLRPLHMSLMRQERLTCSVSYLAELTPQLRQSVLLIKDQYGSGCSFDDAQTLADYALLARGTDGYSSFVERAMSG